MKTFHFFIVFLSTAAAIQFTDAQPSRAKISFDTMEHDFGMILETDGPVDFTFNFTNSGNFPLVISQVKPSCGCTTPEYTREPVIPGKSGSIKVIYNPKNRPGSFKKSVTVSSNAENHNVVLWISGNVVGDSLVEEAYKYAIDGLKIKNIHVAFGSMYKGAESKKTLGIASSSDQALTLGFKNVPDYIAIKSVPEKLNPGEKGYIEVKYSTKNLDEWDYVIDRIEVLINGRTVPNNILTVTAVLKEDFSQLTAQDLADAPRVTFSSERFNFGTIEPGQVVEHEYTLENTGRSDLLIRKVRASCGCTVVQPSETRIIPGKSATIKARFNSTGKSGNQKYAITVITNDPKNYKKIFWLEGFVTTNESSDTNGQKEKP